MKKLTLTKNVLIYLLIAIIALNIIAYFLPYYRSHYVSSYNSDEEIKVVYLYSGYVSVSPFTAMVLIIPIMGITFLLTNFKNSKPFSFAFIASQLMTNILLLLSVKSYIEDRTSDSYTYTSLYGYNMCIAATVLLAITLTSVIVIHIIIYVKTKNSNNFCDNDSHKPKSEIDIFKERITILDDLKQSGVLTDSEYEQKRNEIVKELKL